MPIPRNLTEVTSQWLTRALIVGGLLHGEQVASVAKLAHTDLNWIEVRLEVTYATGTSVHRANLPRRMWLKLAKEHTTPQDKRIGRAEVQYLESVGPRMLAEMPDAPVLRHYGAAFDDASERFYVLLEDPTSTHRPHRGPLPLTMEHYGNAIDAMARVHAFWWEHPDLDSAHGYPHPENMALYSDRIRQVLPAFLSAVGDRIPGRWKELHWRCADGLPQFERRYSGGRNMTLVHGDLTVHKVIYPVAQATRGAILLDWDYWRVDIAAHDQAYLLVLDQTRARRRRNEAHLLRRYHHVLCANGVTGFTWSDCWRDYRLVMIDLLFLPMWQWSLDYPPAVWWPSLTSVLEAIDDLGSAEFAAAA